MQFLEKQQEEVEPKHQEVLTGVIDELCAGKPIQYILEEAWFYKLCFKVNENVLIPRDETEELVDLIIKNERKTGLSKKGILDVGTGSGCIAIALKKNLSSYEVSAMDFSAAALSVAKENAKVHHLEIKFILADILKYQSDEQYDIIVSNPPYVKNDESPDMHQNVLAYEPHSALFVPDHDPLIFYRAIAAFAQNALTPGGRIYFEINEFLGSEMIKLMENAGFKEVQLIKDLQQKDRMLACVR